MMIFTGSDAMVNRNRDSAGPYAVKAQPKNAKEVMLNSFFSTEHFWKLSSNVIKIIQKHKNITRDQ